MESEFSSVLAPYLAAFIAQKRAMGYYADPHKLKRLLALDRFIIESGVRRSSEVHSAVCRWISRPGRRKSRSVEADLTLVREFARFAGRCSRTAQLVDLDRLPRAARAVRFLPYVLSAKELRALLDATRRLRPPALRAHTFRVLVLLLYCMGLRPGEAVRLKLADLDLRARVLVVRQSKGKTRLLAFQSDLARELRAYILARSEAIPPSGCSPLLVQPNGRPYSSGLSSWTLRQLFRHAGLKPQRGRVGPRPYDLRHTFAVHRLTQWYREGANLQAMLPWLSAYMGHEDLLGTETYLHATPELLAFASRRFAARFRRKERR